MNTIEEIASVLKQAKSAVIFTHTRPDGDTLGGGMALSRALSLCGVENEVVNDSEIPEKYLFLSGIREIRQRPTLDAEVYLAVDTSDLARLGRLEETFRAGMRKKITVDLDHHISNPLYGRYRYVRTAASNCENVLALIEAMGVAVKGEIATYLLMGMVTDSGAFTHGDVDGDTLRAAAKAVDGGGDVALLYDRLMRRKSKSQAMLYAEVIGKMKFFREDRLAVVLVTQQQLTHYGLGSDATEGIVDFALGIDCVEVSACLLEVRRGQFKVSLRSKGTVNVNEIARSFGGGGHILASGCMLFGEVEEVYDRLSYAFWQNAGDL